MSTINRKKILFLIESLAGGGAEKVLVTLLNNLDRERFDITLCTITDFGVNKKFLKADITYKSILKKPQSRLSKFVYKLKYKLIYSVLPLKLVYKWFVPRHNDVEVAFVEGFTTKLLSYSTNSTSKKISWVHIDLLNNHWTTSVYKNLASEKNSYRKFDQVVGVSETVTSAVKELFGLKCATTLYNPVDSDEIITKGKDDVPIESNGRFHLVSTGRLVSQKGYDRLLKIVKRLLDDSIDVELTILGEGPDREELQNFIDNHGLGNRVKLPGFMNNPYAFMKQCDLFVCSSRSEGYSTAVTEALILGLPVITTNCSGMNELLNGGEYGIITDNSEESLFTALKELLTSPDKLSSYKHKAEERGEYFKLDNQIRKIEEFLLQ